MALQFWSRWAARVVLLGAGLGLAACASQPRIPYTEIEASTAVVNADPQARTWANNPDPKFIANTQGVRAALAKLGERTTYLALSGGGGDGAFGAGLINGWTESGTRPAELSIVSGVSTGALMAPFAFLGPRYDPVLRDLYTSGIAETLLDSPDPLGAIFGASLFSNDRLRNLVDRFITPEILAEIATERDRGRLLFVITTNLDQQRPVLWDMGAIAKEGTPQALNLFRTVLVASASVPAVFPPVMIDAVGSDGRTFQELHVDGTVTSSVYTLPRNYLLRRVSLPGARGGTLYVLMNGKIEPDFQVVNNNTAEIGARTFSTFVRDQARTDLALAERVAHESHMDFKLAAIDRSFQDQRNVGFDTAYMRRLYQYGYEQGRTGHFWMSSVPGLPAAAPARREVAQR